MECENKFMLRIIQYVINIILKPLLFIRKFETVHEFHFKNEFGPKINHRKGI